MKKKVTLKVLVICFFIALLLSGTLAIRDFYVEKKLGNNYLLCVWARDAYDITYRVSFWEDGRPVLHDFVSELEYSNRWIFVKSLSGRYWVIDKSIPYHSIDDSLQKKIGRYSESVIGPLDSLSFISYKDSVRFQNDCRGKWALEDE